MTEQAQENTDSIYDIEAIGRGLRRLRWSKGLSTVAFSLELETTPLLIEILEHAGADGNTQLSGQLSGKWLRHLLEQVRRVYGISAKELCAIPEDRASAMEEQELSVYVPVTISVNQCMDILDQMLLYVQLGQNRRLRNRMMKCCTLTSSLLMRLLYAAHRQRPGKEAASCLTQFSNKIEERLQALK